MSGEGHRCSCIDASEVEDLHKRDDTSLSIEVAKGQKSFAIGLLVLAVPMFAVGIVDLYMTLPGPWALGILAGPAALIVGLVELIRGRKLIDPGDPRLLFTWIADKRFLCHPQSNPEMRRALNYVLPSNRSRYDESLKMMEELAGRKNATDIWYASPGSKNVVLLERQQGLPPLASYSADLNLSDNSGFDSKIGTAAFWTVKSPRGDWWIILHSKDCAEEGIAKI